MTGFRRRRDGVEAVCCGRAVGVDGVLRCGRRDVVVVGAAVLAVGIVAAMVVGNTSTVSYSSISYDSPLSAGFGAAVVVVVDTRCLVYLKSFRVVAGAGVVVVVVVVVDAIVVVVLFDDFIVVPNVDSGVRNLDDTFGKTLSFFCNM